MWCSPEQGLLATITVALRVDDSTALGVMHRLSGAEEEVLEVMGTGYKHRVRDLTDVWRADADQGDGVLRARRDGWAAMATVRGFTGMCDAFLSSVRSQEVLSARDALRTHEICEQVVAAAQTGGASSVQNR